MSYTDFIERKLALIRPTGLSDVPTYTEPLYKPHQSALIRWALRRGRCAIFADTGLGKTRMELAYGQAVHEHIDQPIIIFSPLAVAAQSVREAEKLGLTLNHCRSDSDIRGGLNIINYDRLHLIDPHRFGGVILDESGIIKHHDTRTLATLLDCFADTQFKLCASATPAPNDWTELGTHAEFLGICSRSEMLAEFFVHDGAETQVWRLKGHARGAFWRWVSAWGAMVRRPSDLGFSDEGYILPPLNVHEHIVGSDLQPADGQLFALEASSMSERRDARRASMTQRVQACAERVNGRDEQEIIWCDLNAESQALTRAIDGAVELTGSMDADVKEKIILDFCSGRIPKVVSKASIMGFGINAQSCHRQSFVGVSDSYEKYYQAVRRSWRFGQKHAVEVNIYISEFEGPVLANLRRKEADAEAMARALSAETSSAVIESVLGSERQSNLYQPKARISAPSWLKEVA